MSQPAITAHNLGETRIGLKPNITALLCYLLGWITAFVFYVIIENENRFVRFHALQSIIVFGGLTAIYIVIPIMIFVLGPFIHMNVFAGGSYYAIFTIALSSIGLGLWIF